MKFLSIYLLLTMVYSLNAQDIPELASDTTVQTFFSKSTKDPGKAALYSAIFPGLGQIYNGQYWKLPVVYGAFMFVGHFARQNHELYNVYLNALIAENDGDASTVNPYSFNSSNLEFIANRYRRDRDYQIILLGLVYVLNIVEAHVSAHLLEFDINDELSLQTTPMIQQNWGSVQTGFTFSLNIK